MKKSGRALYLAGLISEEGEEGVSSDDPRFLAWTKELEVKFPTDRPSGLSMEDMKNLYVGRVINVLDEFGETSRWPELAGSPDLNRTVKNYEELIDRFVKTYHPGMYRAYWDYNNLKN